MPHAQTSSDLISSWGRGNQDYVQFGTIMMHYSSGKYHWCSIVAHFCWPWLYNPHIRSCSLLIITHVISDVTLTQNNSLLFSITMQSRNPLLSRQYFAHCSFQFNLVSIWKSNIIIFLKQILCVYHEDICIKLVQ